MTQSCYALRMIIKDLAAIKPGVNYPCRVNVVETVKGQPHETTFRLQSYCVGMYCAIDVNGALAMQTGDYDNKHFVSTLKKDLAKAIERGAEVTCGVILPVKTLDN